MTRLHAPRGEVRIPGMEFIGLTHYVRQVSSGQGISMPLTDEQKEDIQAKIEWEGGDYYFSGYASSKYLEKEYGDEKLVELHRKFLQAREELFNYVGL